MSSASQNRVRSQGSSIPPEVPRRPLIAPTSVSEPVPLSSVAPATHQPPRQGPNGGVSGVREIHKNAWLKRQHIAYDKKGVPFVRRSEKWWVVFCVHEDVDPFLEFYTEPKMAAVHKPASRTSLNTCLHVSVSSIMGQDNEYEFAVTLPSQVIRLAAADWDQMLEWVESLQGKLREMNVLSPKDNLYSKLPESRACGVNFTTYGSTRDPNSPLPAPPTPNGNVSPGIPPAPLANEYIETSDANHSRAFHRSELHATSINLQSRSFDSSTSASVYVQARSTSFLREGNGSGSDSGNGSAGSVLSTDSLSSIQPRGCITRNSNAILGTSSSSTVAIEPGQPREDVGRAPAESKVVSSNNNSTLVHIGFENPPALDPVSVSISSQQSTELAPDCLSNGTTCQKISRQRPRTNPRKLKTDLGMNFERLVLRLPANEPSSSHSLEEQLFPPTPDTQSSADSTTTNESTGNVYEHLFIDAKNARTERSATPIETTASNNPESTSEASCPPVIPRRNPSMKRLQRRMQLQNTVGQVGTGRISPSHDVSDLRGSNNFRPDVDTSTTTSETHPLEGMIEIQGGEYRVASRREVQTTSSLRTPAAIPTAGGSGVPHTVAHVPLKESQVLRLKSEINHAPGVRIVLRKKDCLDTIAFVDYLGAVWVAGWKQHEHPVLYYAFHIGDQVVKVGGEKVQSAEDVRRAIKITSSSQVQFIIRRLPFGKVFVLKRKVEGEPIGLVAVGAEISEVVPHSLAAAEGLVAQTPSADGQTLCNWILTEVNNRPLSLLAREQEVRERLNALGKEISILVQPSDFVKHLKKQLKAVRGFKDYLVV